MADARTKLREDYGIQLDSERVSELMYADDTLLVGTDGRVVEKYLACIIDLGATYGLEMNWKKVELLTAKCDADIRNAEGNNIRTKASIVYLGASVAADGCTDSELARQIGLAEAEFRTLKHVWRHASLNARDRYKVYEACVLSRLLYGLQVIWLGQAARRRLDGFHARCLRTITGTPPSYYSRVSNEDVLAKVGAPKLSALLLERQLGYFGTLARRPTTCQVRRLVFNEDYSRALEDGTRRRGRPKLQWSNELFRITGHMFSNHADFIACITRKDAWRKRIHELTRATAT